MANQVTWNIATGTPTVAVVGLRIRVTFPRALLETLDLLNPARYSITAPPNYPVLRVTKVTVVTPHSLDLSYAGKMEEVVYTLTITPGTVRNADGVVESITPATFSGTTQATPAKVVLSPRTSFLGQGLSYPLHLDSSGDFAKTSGEANVDECVIQLLRTKQGERPFAVRNGVLFGTTLDEVLFEDINVAADLASRTIREALEVWEPRVQLLDTEVLTQGSALILNVKYLIRSTNNIRNLVIPYAA